MTREERAAHNARGVELSEQARSISIKLARAFTADGKADLPALADLGKRAAKFERDFEKWWIER